MTTRVIVDQNTSSGQMCAEAVDYVLKAKAVFGRLSGILYAAIRRFAKDFEASIESLRLAHDRQHRSSRDAWPRSLSTHAIPSRTLGHQLRSACA
jgi:hypothetical protein